MNFYLEIPMQVSGPMMTSQLDGQDVHINIVDSIHPHPQVQVIICSCSSHTTSEEVRMLPSSPFQTPVININNNSLPTQRHILTNLNPFSTETFRQKYIHNNLHLFQQAKDKFHTLPISLIPRVGKYLQKPWLIPILFRRGQVWIQNTLGIEGEVHKNSVYNFIGLMSPRLWFNIWAVIIWVLIRKFLELFGIYFDLAVKEESTPFRGYGKMPEEENMIYDQESRPLNIGDKEKENVEEIAGESSGRAEEATWDPVKQSHNIDSEPADDWQRIR